MNDDFDIGVASSNVDLFDSHDAFNNQTTGGAYAFLGESAEESPTQNPDAINENQLKYSNMNVGGEEEEMT